LNETKSTSDKVFQLAKAEFETQKIMVRSLEEKLRLIGIVPEKLNEDNISRSINIYSPIDGYVTKVNVNIGKYVAPSDVLFELINPSDLHVRLTVFENDAANLAVGQKIICTTNGRPDDKYSAAIHLITPNIGEDRATEVHCHLEKYDKRLLPGTFMNAAIELNNARVTVVPEEAVVKWENKYYLFSQEAENRFKLLPVETGAINDGFIEIKTALPSTNIITKNAYTILMKMKNNAED
jgi:cobalt-zinc-cadmium efflux system membrane fusion protein